MWGLNLRKCCNFYLFNFILQELSPLEERLVSLRLPFMQIKAVGSQGQSILKGNIVNVENDLDVCAQVLPRRFDDTSTVHVQLMRRMRYNVPYMYEIIRPKVVFEAAKMLLASELYVSHGATLCDDWYAHQGGNWSQYESGINRNQLCFFTVKI